MRVLYLTNIHNPYRDKFYNQLGRHCKLTVLFEKKNDSSRDMSWFETEGERGYREIYIPDGEKSFVSKTILETVRQDWDFVIVGCFNSPRQAVAAIYMQHKRIPYAINSDGMIFDACNRLKLIIRNRVLRGANAYLVAGEQAINSLRRVVGNTYIQPYPFGSLTKSETAGRNAISANRVNTTILSVGQYKRYKGLDVLLDAAALLPDFKFRIIGMGNRQAEFEYLIAEKGLNNVETIAFLKPEELALEYASAGMFVLPSRQECWGLVVNEAASCGCPIVSTWGSGAAVEFLSERYPQFLARPGDAGSLARAMRECLEMGEPEREEYRSYLKEKAGEYTIEAMVDAHMELLRRVAREG